MKYSIKEAAEHFQKLKVWVYPAYESDYRETDICFRWKDWRNKNEAEYAEEAKDYHWGFSEELMYKNIVMGDAISLVLGKKGLIAIRCKKESFFHGYTIQETLKELGLPLDYKWVFSNDVKEYTYIIIDAISLPSGTIPKTFSKYDVITEEGLILYMDFDSELIPQERPKQIAWHNVIIALTHMNERNFKCEFKFWKYVFKSIDKGITINENSGCFLVLVGVLTVSLLKNLFLDIVELPNWIEFTLGCPIIGEGIIFVCICIIISSVAFLYKRIKK